MTNETEASTFACKRVWERGEPILHVCHDVDGDWQFLCGENERIHSQDEAMLLIHAKHMFDLRPKLEDVEDLAFGSYTWRASTTDPWQRYDALDAE